MSGDDKKLLLNQTNLFYILGVMVLLLSFVPYLLLGENSYIPFHDQLDGEVVNYIYRAKYLLSGTDSIPEFMNGMAKSSMTLPAPLGVLFYLALPPFPAYVVMQLCMVLAGYTGMFLLVRDITGKNGIALIVGGMFSCIPFYPVYGLAILGQPLLLWGFLQLYKNRNKGKAVCAILTYALFSSLVLVGFAWLGLGILAALVLLLKGRQKRKEGLRISLGVLLLAVVYGLCNFDLVKEVLGIGESYVTHREEMTYMGMSLSLQDFIGSWIGNGIYVPTCAAGILLFVVLLAMIGVISLLFRKDWLTGVQKYGQGILVLLGLTVLLVLAGQLWNVEPILALRRSLGGIFLYFQAGRVVWTLPVWWYLIFALCLAVINTWKGKWITGLRMGGMALAVLLVGASIFKISPLNKNIRLLLFPNTYSQITWADIYAEDVFGQISACLPAEKSAYRVASIGMYPSAALYNGFYCLDGYSNNYSLAYKHEFREIIKKELEKNKEISRYFDEWGNRCYLMTDETGYAALLSKESGLSLKNMDLNMERFVEMGGQYIFSAVPIENAEEERLTLLEGSPFETEESFYEIWVYEAQALFP